MKEKIKLVNNVLFLENIEGSFFRLFHGLFLFGQLISFGFEIIQRAMLIWGASTIWQIRASIIIVLWKKENYTVLSSVGATN